MQQHKQRHFYFLSLVICLCADLGFAASFDCAKAVTAVEKMLCADPDLGLLDERMALAYEDARAAAGDDTRIAESFRTEQRQWLKKRNACKSTECLDRLYEERIQSLTGGESWLSVKTRLEESGPHYSIEATFPELTGTGAAIDSANREIRDYVDGILAPFHEDVAEELAPELKDSGEAGASPQMRDWSLVLESGELHHAQRYLAIPFSGYDDRGGAHGLPLQNVLVISRSTGKRILPEGLFAAGSEWLQTLSRLCRRDLPEQLSESGGEDFDVELMLEGTEPSPDNFSVLFPEPEGLRVIFPPYQVAAYVMGSPEVLIPYADLAGILEPELFGP